LRLEVFTGNPDVYTIMFHGVAEPFGGKMSEEEVVALLDRASNDHVLRARLRTATAGDIGAIAASLGFSIGSNSYQDVLTDADLDGIASAATDRTCHGTTDCCHTKRTCFGTTDCCR
jgi:hypothetical protein